MPRNGSGTMAVVNSFTPSTTISSSAVNTNFSDIADEITNSVAVDGQSTLTGALKAANGSASAPSLTFGSDTNTGIYRKGADSLGFGVGGTEHGYIDSSGNWVIPTGDLTLSAGDLTLTAGSITNHVIGTDIQAFDAFLDDIADLTDPNADSGLFWDDSAGVMAFWTPSGALSFSDTNLVFNSPMPTVQRFTSGSDTYTPAAGTSYIRVRMVGGGGGGGSGTNSGSPGGTTSLGSWTAVGGSGGGPNAGTGGAGGSGGADGTGTLIARFSGQDGGDSPQLTFGVPGASSIFGGGSKLLKSASAGGAAKANTGSGGGGGISAGSTEGASGGAGEYVEFFVSSPGELSYSVGDGGGGGAPGTAAGGAGAAGIIIIEEYA